MSCFRPWYSICLWLAALCAFPQAAFAQLQYTNSTDGTVNETVTPCTNPLVRNFTVSDIYTVADVNIGILMSHTYRGGIWRLEICDSLTTDSGTFYQSDLFITAMPATVNVAKTSSVISDPISLANPKAIPTATVRYCITISNAGPGTAAAISATDSIPANMSYVGGSMLSGSTCGTAATAEDDDTSDGSELDAVTASHSAGTITINRASLTNGASFAVTFAAIIN
mgnify:CR=1 FL=1